MAMKLIAVLATYFLGAVTAPLLLESIYWMHDAIWRRLEDAWQWLTTPPCRVCGAHHDTEVYHFCSHCAGRGYRPFTRNSLTYSMMCGNCSGTGIAR